MVAVAGQHQLVEAFLARIGVPVTPSASRRTCFTGEDAAPHRPSFPAPLLARGTADHAPRLRPCNLSIVVVMNAEVWPGNPDAWAGEDHRADAIGTRWSSMNIRP